MIKKIILNLGILLFLVTQTFATITGDNIIISEVGYYPSTANGGSAQKNEWFEFYNPTPNSIDVSGWTFTDNEGTATIPNGTSIASDTYFIATHTATAGKLTEFPDVDVDLEYGNIDVGSIYLANSSDELVLKDDAGVIIDETSWGGEANFNLSTTQGNTILRSTSIDTDLEGDWLSDQVASPGTGNLTVINNTPNDPITTPDLTDATDSGSSNSDNKTSDNTPDFDVECSEAGNIITLYSDNPAANTNIGEHTCVAVGTETVTANTLADGSHNISYTDKNGSNESGGSPTLNVIIDTVSPVITLNGSANTNLLVGDVYIELGAACTDNIDAGCIVIVGGDTVDTSTVGTYNITYGAVDGSGNTATIVEREVGVAAPVIHGRSGKSHKGKSGKKVCKDTKALNFSNVGQHDQKLCKYKKSEKDILEKEKNNSNENDKKCPSSQILTQNMKKGDKNGKYSLWEKGNINEIKILQSHMNRLGFEAGPIDGIFGKLTEAAVKRMQKFLGFKTKLIDGYVGSLTRDRINYSCINKK